MNGLMRSVGYVVDDRAGGARGRYGTPNPTVLGVAGRRAGTARRARLRQGTAQPVHLAAAARPEASSSVGSAASPAASASAARRLLPATFRRESMSPSRRELGDYLLDKLAKPFNY